LWLAKNAAATAGKIRFSLLLPFFQSGNFSAVALI
jgi:hypothetical protein